MSKINLDNSVQINNGLKQTCADGAALAFDSKYGIMFCAYMPGYHGDYGESRGKVALSYFPASQPTNIKFLEVAVGNDVYVPNIISLGEGKVRIFYEKDSRKYNDHAICYKDFDFIAETLSEEQRVYIKLGEMDKVPLCQSECFKYLEGRGYFNHKYKATEQIIFGGCTFFLGEDGCYYGSVSSEYSEVILFRSQDCLETIEFFAVYPKPVEYEFDYKFLNHKIYAIYRTDQEPNGTSFVYSEDYGRTWSEPVELEESIRCRPRLIISNQKVIMAYNCYNPDTGNRPWVAMGRTAVRIATVTDQKVEILEDLHSKYGIVNIALADILGDVYMAYSTSELALEYQNGTPRVRGKDAIRYIKLGDFTEYAKRN